jgi:hypothetical protein
VTTSPPQPPQNPYPGQPGGYGPPPEQFPQYAQPQQQPGQGYGAQPSQPQQGQTYGQPGQQYAQPQAPYGQRQPSYQHGQYQQGQASSQGVPSYPSQTELTCRFCGGYPAADATVRGHQGLLVLMRFLKLDGPFCRFCGIASVRQMTSRSLWQGWWGLGSSIINPITLLMNIGPMRKFKKLPEPSQGPGRPMEPGKPLFQRPAILGLLIPVAAIALIVFSAVNSTSSTAEVGRCVVNKGTDANPKVEVVDCGSSDAQYRIVGRLDNSTDDSQCDQFAGAEATYVYNGRYTKYTLCLGSI